MEYLCARFIPEKFRPISLMISDDSSWLNHRFMMTSDESMIPVFYSDQCFRRKFKWLFLKSEAMKETIIWRWCWVKRNIIQQLWIHDAWIEDSWWNYDFWVLTQTRNCSAIETECFRRANAMKETFSFLLWASNASHQQTNLVHSFSLISVWFPFSYHGVATRPRTLRASLARCSLVRSTRSVFLRKRSPGKPVIPGYR